MRKRAKAGEKSASDTVGCVGTEWKEDVNSMRLPSGTILIRVMCIVGAAVGIVWSAPAAGQEVRVTLNGSALNLSPLPQERAGRIFVPLRGIFEQLGASVVYQNGIINAQGNGRAVSLHIGSTQATVNGQLQNLDVAPFVVGASTYVPLRFVSQALGAGVNYDAANKIVALTNGGAPAASPTASNASRVRLGPVRPTRDATVAAQRPTVEAQFVGGEVDPNTLRITLDDLDITAASSRSPSGFVFSPPSDLESVRHMVRVIGNDKTGAPFEARWSFTSGTSAVENKLGDVAPPEGAQVGSQFTVSGRTLPGALVVVQVGAAAGNTNTVAGAVGSILGLGGAANVRNEVTANADGSFSTVIAINAPPGTTLQMILNSTDPRTKSAAHPVARTLTVR
jgi:hypothetical protein